MRAATMLLPIFLLCLAAGPASADEVRDKAEAALRAWEAGRGDDAIALLQDAIAAIQGGTEAGLAAALPDRVGEYVGDEVESASGSWGSGTQAMQWISATRSYAREGGGESVTVSLSTSPQMLEGQRAMMAMFQDPQMLAMMNTEPGRRVELVDEAGFRGWVTIEEGVAQMTAIGEKLMATIEVHDGDVATLARFRQAIPLRDLASLDGR